MLRLLLLFLFSGQSLAAIQVAHTTLEARISKGKDKELRMLVALCENRGCRSLTNRQGYTALEWTKLRKMCHRKENFIPLGNVLEKLGLLAGIFGKTPAATAASYILSSFGTSREEAEAIRAVNKRFGNFRSGDITLNVSDFYHVIEGIKSCSHKFEDYRAHVEMGMRIINK
jgi:hypothetical protein